MTPTPRRIPRGLRLPPGHRSPLLPPGGEDEVGLVPEDPVLGEALHDPLHVLQAVPARDLDDHRRLRVERRTVGDDGGTARDSPAAWLPFEESCATSGPASTPTVVRIERTSGSARPWFFGENGSMEGWIVVTRSAGSHEGA